MRSVLTLLFLLTGFSTLAAEASPTIAAQTFYDGYMKVLRANGDPEKYVLGSELLTGGFKKAYAKLVKEGLESDPIICGQDYPDEGYTASPAKLKKGKAIVTMKSRSPAMNVSFKVTLREIDGAWRISDTNDLKADAED